MADNEADAERVAPASWIYRGDKYFDAGAKLYPALELTLFHMRG